MQIAKRGSTVSLEVELANEAGEVVERSHPDDPLELVIGDGAMPEEVEAALVGAEVGSSVEVQTAPGVAFGETSVEAIVSVPLEDFDEDADLQKGLEIEITVEHEDGEVDEILALILEVSEDAVILDANHPLAGKAVTFRLKVLAISS